MTKKQIKSEFPNEVDNLRAILGELKVKLPGLDIFLLENPECTRCSNSKDYHCVPLKGKPGCRTCTTRRISCSRHIQYLVETAASRLEWSVEKTKTMYDKHVKQTRTGKKPLSKVKKTPNRKAVDGPQSVDSGSAANQTAAGSSKGRRNVAAPEGDDYEGDGGSDSQVQQALEDLENDDPEDPELYDDHELDGNEISTVNNIPHLSATLRTPSSNPRVFPREGIFISHPQVTIPILESEELDCLNPGLHDSISLVTDSGKTVTVHQVDDLTALTQIEDERNREAVLGSQSEHIPESSMSAEQRIKQLEEKVAKLNTLRRADEASISRLKKKADIAFDNISVLLNRIYLHRQELGTTVTKHIEPPHQKPFKSLISKMDETSVSATRILMLLDKRKNYVLPKTRVPVIIIDEDGQEWVPWDVISDDNILRDAEMDKKRRRDDGVNGETDEGSSKRRKS